MDVFQGQGPDSDTVVDLIEPLRRYVRARTATATDADDVVQETLARLLERRGRLTADSLLAYAIVVARNVITDQLRLSARKMRTTDDYIDLTDHGTPEDSAVAAERDQALRIALVQVPSPQRDALLAHVLDEQSLEDIAEERDTTSGSIGAQLARTRAKLRLDYLLALRRIELPTGRCRPVLLALSAGDGRRQEALRAGQHLLVCSACAALSEPLLERRRALAAILPWLAIGTLLDLLRRIPRPSPTQAGTLTATALVVSTVVATAAVVRDDDPPAARPAAATKQSPPTTPVPTALEVDASAMPTPAQLAAADGENVTATSMPVLSVPADEGFWIGTSTNRIWVQVLTTGGESAATVNPGDVVSFTGQIRLHDAAFASDSGLSNAEGAHELTQDQAHIAVPAASLQLNRR